MFSISSISPSLLHEFQGPDVKDFNPDRFIGEDGKLLPALADTKDGMTSLPPTLCCRSDFRAYRRLELHLTPELQSDCLTSRSPLICES